MAMSSPAASAGTLNSRGSHRATPCSRIITSSTAAVMVARVEIANATLVPWSKEMRAERWFDAKQVAANSRMTIPRRGANFASMLADVIKVAALLLACSAQAQVPPSSAEAARFAGLHGAAHRGDADAIGRLAAAGADLNARDSQGRTPLHVACFARQRDAIRALARAGADLHLLENDRYDGVTIAAVADDQETLAVLLSLGASAQLVTSRYDGTALIAAAHLGHDAIVKQLIAAKAPLDHVNNLHWTAVIESIVLGNGGARHQETLRALIRAGASLSLADRQGNTPLALARSRGYREMARMLEEAGAR